MVLLRRLPKAAFTLASLEGPSMLKATPIPKGFDNKKRPHREGVFVRGSAFSSGGPESSPSVCSSAGNR